MPPREDCDSIHERLRLYGKQRRTAAVTAHRDETDTGQGAAGAGRTGGHVHPRPGGRAGHPSALEARITGRIAHAWCPSRSLLSAPC